MNKLSKYAMAFSALGLVVATQPAQAVEVPFVGTVVSACALVVGTPGVFGLNVDGDVLSSKEAGGVSGSVTATATSPTFAVSVASPTTFTSIPSGAEASATFSSSYTTSGATTTPETNEGTSTNLNSGITLIGVDLTAEKVSGIYPAGVYAAPVTVTCE